MALYFKNQKQIEIFKTIMFFGLESYTNADIFDIAVLEGSPSYNTETFAFNKEYSHNISDFFKETYKTYYYHAVRYHFLKELYRIRDDEDDIFRDVFMRIENYNFVVKNAIQSYIDNKMNEGNWGYNEKNLREKKYSESTIKKKKSAYKKDCKNKAEIILKTNKEFIDKLSDNSWYTVDEFNLDFADVKNFFDSCDNFEDVQIENTDESNENIPYYIDDVTFNEIKNWPMEKAYKLGEMLEEHLCLSSGLFGETLSGLAGYEGTKETLNQELAVIINNDKNIYENQPKCPNCGMTYESYETKCRRCGHSL